MLLYNEIIKVLFKMDRYDLFYCYYFTAGF